MLCLGIESSCDESAFALVCNGKLIGQTLKSQVDVHALFGGVVPEIASREHGRVMPALYDLLLTETGIAPQDIDCIAVARGPGLLGSLLVGIAFAKGLSFALDKPVIGVNHLHAHLLAAGLEQELTFPAFGLLVSGGHTHIYQINSCRDFVLLGRSIDDAAGEAIDKFGKMLGLPYPAGKFIDEFSQGGEFIPGLFAKPYLNNANFDFSFSGLKTAANLYLNNKPELHFSSGVHGEITAPHGEAEQKLLRDVCVTFLHTVADTLWVKVERAMNSSAAINAHSLILAGGVAANSVIRAKFKQECEKRNCKLIVASSALCTDNAAMISYTGFLLSEQNLYSPLGFSAVPRGQQVPDDYSVFLS